MIWTNPEKALRDKCPEPHDGLAWVTPGEDCWLRRARSLPQDGMIMELTARPATLWDTARLDGQNVLINLAAHELPENLVIIPVDVWTRLWGSNAHAVNRAHANRAEIEKAINRGWNDDRCKEIVGVGHPGHMMQLWLDDADFG